MEMICKDSAQDKYIIQLMSRLQTLNVRKAVFASS